MTMADFDPKRIIETMFPIEWDMIADCDLALNRELRDGVFPDGHWTEVEPLANYQWTDWVSALRDLEELLEPLPRSLWVNTDLEIVTETDPYNDPDNYVPCVTEYGDGESGDDLEWIGGSYWDRIDPREIVLGRHSYQQMA